MALTVLTVAYPFAAMGPDAVGGAEQVATAVEAAVVAAGHRSVVIACEGSVVAGQLLAVPAVTGPIDDFARATVHAHVRARIEEALARDGIDLVHLHGIDAQQTLPPPGTPAVLTLHLPVAWYDPTLIRRPQAGLHLVPVSPSQAATLPPGVRTCDPIENGVPVEALGRARHAQRDFALFLGRICPEKGVHLAIEAATRADRPLLIAGEAFGYPAHRAYFETEVAPRLDARRRWIGPVGFARKRRLLSAARCLLVPSLAPETSSLVAREAAACGTAVVAFAAGALPDTVEQGRTGFIVGDVEEMAGAIRRAGDIDPDMCRQVARRRFSLEAMTESYLALYGRIAGDAAARGAA